MLLVGCSGGATRHQTPLADLSPLDAAVRAVSADRGFVLAALDAVQRGASALDATDQVCATGEGVAARSRHRASLPVTHAARVALAMLSARVVTYRQALDDLAAARSSVSASASVALDNVVRDGQAEASAAEVFRVEVVRVWPQYDQLDADEDTWIVRAVTPWYRTAKEGAAAYAVLVDGHRPALEAARARLMAAAAAVQGPSMTQSATLAAADKALAGYRAKR